MKGENVLRRGRGKEGKGTDKQVEHKKQILCSKNCKEQILGN
jgi:hypothetical protein